MYDKNHELYGAPMDTPHEVWEQRVAGFNPPPPQPIHCEPEKCTPVPPPIPPVRYVPGMNVQEQLCNMAERVNVSINRWNQIQSQCYKALDEVVGAAVNNDVYYAPDEVRIMEGYDESAACSYSVVEARAVDRSGKPIFCHLRAAYNNETNSGARENIADVSFITSGQMVITAVQATETRWKGTTIFNGNPAMSNPDDTVWVCGWTRNGVLRFFRGDVDEGTLRQNRMVNCIGPVFPIIKDGKAFEEVVGSMGEEPGSIQAIGWKPNGNKVFFNCGVYDEPGMTPAQVMNTMQSMGCKTAVITSYQTKAATAWDATPIAGTESRMNTDPEVISVPGMTGGMTFLGKLTAAPIQWNIPQNCAAWVISKKPARGWHNAFTTEVANVVQRLGNQENSMGSIMGQLKGENEAISKLQYDVQQNADNIATVKETVETFDERINDLDKRMTAAETRIANNAENITRLQADLQTEVNTRTQQVQELQAADALEKQERIAADNQEKAERQAADNVLQAAINAEAQARESADTVLQNNIDEEANIRSGEDAKLRAEIDSEATTRAQADRNLQAAIEAEASARSTKDTQHEARMDAIEAQEQKDKAELKQDIQDVNDTIETLKDGSGLPIATTEQLGVIKVGANLTITEDGTLNAKADEGSGGDTVVAGDGISITDNVLGEKVIAADFTKVATTETTDALNYRVEVVETKQTEQAAKDQLQDEAIKQNTDNIAANDVEIAKIKEDVGAVQDVAQGAADDVATLQQTVTDLDTKVDGIGTDLTATKETLTNVQTEIDNIQSGESLPYATTTTGGIIKVGANLTIDDNGVLSATGGGSEPGETVAAGEGISVTHQNGVATVSLRDEVKTAVDQIPALKEEVDKIVEAGGEIQIQAGVGIDIDTETESGKAIIGINQATQEKINNAAETSKRNTVSITTMQSQLTLMQDDIDNVRSEASNKVNKNGDTMTGSLQFNGTEEGRSVTVSDGGIVFNDSTTIYADNGQINFVNSYDTPVIISGIEQGEGDNDAVNMSQLTGVAQLAEDAVADAASALTATNTLRTTVSGLNGRIEASEQSVAALETAVNEKVSKSGDTMSGALRAPTITTEQGISIIRQKTYGIGLQNTGGTFTISPVDGALASSLVKLAGIDTPGAWYDAANKKYVDERSIAYSSALLRCTAPDEFHNAYMAIMSITLFPKKINIIKCYQDDATWSIPNYVFQATSEFTSNIGTGSYTVYNGTTTYLEITVENEIITIKRKKINDNTEAYGILNESFIL